MKTGDLVRFALWEDIVDIDDWSTTPKGHVGILIEYDTLHKAARILYEGEIHMIRGQLVEKAGTRDFVKKEAFE
tara:strand:- start:236 stop:457 length:222 start_codon:yes stop_codon:yes gene_type:complete